METSGIRSVLLGPEVAVALCFVLAVYFLPPLLTGSQLLFDSLAAPVWRLAIDTGSAVGCGSLSCVPLILAFFAVYTYVLAVVVGALFRTAATVLR